MKDEIAKSKSKPAKLLLACLEAISESNAESFSTALRGYLDYYLKNEFDKGGIRNYFSIEGSILWHVAQRAGIEPTGLTDKQQALIMTRESLGLAT